MPKRHDRIIAKALQFQANGKKCLILLPIQHGHSHYRLHKLLLPRVAQSGRSFSKLLADQQIFERQILELWLESFKLLPTGRTNQVWNGESNVLSVPYHGEFLTNPLIPSLFWKPIYLLHWKIGCNQPDSWVKAKFLRTTQALSIWVKNIEESTRENSSSLGSAVGSASVS